MAEADVVVENFGARARRSLGLDESWGFARRPDLVWASLTGYGRTGPEAERDGWDLVAQARGGLLDITGEPDGPPMKTGNSSADYLAGVHLAVGILAALHQRDKTHEGQLVDVSLLEAVVVCLDGFPMWHSISGVTPKRNGNFHLAQLPGYSVFPASDGYIVIGSAGPSFARLMALLGREELATTVPPAGEAERQAWFDEVVDLITRWTSRRPRGGPRARALSTRRSERLGAHARRGVERPPARGEGCLPRVRAVVAGPYPHRGKPDPSVVLTGRSPQSSSRGWRAQRGDPACGARLRRCPDHRARRRRRALGADES